MLKSTNPKRTYQHTDSNLYKDIFAMEHIWDKRNIANLNKIQSCEMSNHLHGANLPSQILPQEKRVNHDKFSTEKEQNKHKRLFLENKS